MRIGSLHFSIVLLLAWLGGCATQSAVAPPPEHAKRVPLTLSFDDPQLDETLPVNPNVTMGKLPNGLTYFVMPNHEPKERVELRMAVRAGSILEDEDQLGLAHLMEHMAFNGTEHFAHNDLVTFLESIGTQFGPHLNAYTNWDQTVFMIQIPTDQPELVDKGFLVLSDWAHALTLDDEEIDKERGVVLEEWRTRKSAQSRVYEATVPLMRGERYGNRIPIGTEESLKTFTHDALKRFYSDWYRPDLMGIVVVGDVDPVAMVEKIKTQFGGLVNPANERPRTEYHIPDHQGTLTSVIMDPELTSSQITVFWKEDFAWGDTYRDYANSLVGDLVYTMLRERLSKIGRQVDPPFLRAAGFKGVLNRTKEGHYLMAMVKQDGAERGLEALLTEAKRVRQYGFLEDELERARATVMRQSERYYEERDKTASRAHASEIIRYFTVDELMPGSEGEYELHKRFIPQISLADVNQYVQNWFTNDNRVVMMALPEKDDAKKVTEKDVDNVIARVDGLEVEAPKPEETVKTLMEVLPAPGTVVSENTTPETGITEWTLSNGIRVLVKPTDFKNDELRFDAFSWGGHSNVSDEDYIAAVTAAALTLESGAGPVNRTQLDNFLTGKTVHVQPYISELREGIRGLASPKDLETMFQLIHLYLTAPRFDNDAFARVVDQRKEYVVGRQANPEAVAWDEHARKLYNDHLRRRPWTLETLDAMSLETSSDVYLDRFTDLSDMTFVFVGNADMEALKKQVLTYIASLPGNKSGETWKDIGVSFPDKSIESTVHKGIDPKGRVTITFYGDAPFSEENEYIMNSMVDAVRIRTREVIREDLSGTYGVGVRGRLERLPKERYTVTFSFGCDPERVDELSSALLKELDNIRQAPLSEDYLQRVTETQRRNYETHLRENRYWLNEIMKSELRGEDPAEILEYPAMVDKLTTEMIHQAAKTYLVPERMVKTVLLPAEDSGTPEDATQEGTPE